MAAVHSAAGKRACGYGDVAACTQILAWHHDHHLCRSRAERRKGRQRHAPMIGKAAGYPPLTGHGADAERIPRTAGSGCGTSRSTRMRGSAGHALTSPGPGTVWAGAGPDLTPATADS